MTDVQLFTGGSCFGGVGPGGWCFILRHEKNGKELVCSEFVPSTTSNQIELLPVIAGLAALSRPVCLELFSSSDYVVQGVNHWMSKWKSYDWQRTPNGKSIKYPELWQRIDLLLSSCEITATHVSRYTGTPEIDRCYRLATAEWRKLKKALSHEPARPAGRFLLNQGELEMSEVKLFTDGACSPNPGPGGWAFILRHEKSGKELVRSGGLRATTNNQMEMLAVIEGLSALKRPTSVELVSDSQYVLKGIAEWMPNWKKNGWMRGGKGSRTAVKNADLWQRLDALVSQHSLKYTWIRGHTGHVENERCDQLAVEAGRLMANM